MLFYLSLIPLAHDSSIYDSLWFLFLVICIKLFRNLWTWIIKSSRVSLIWMLVWIKVCFILAMQKAFVESILPGIVQWNSDKSICFSIIIEPIQKSAEHPQIPKKSEITGGTQYVTGLGLKCYVSVCTCESNCLSVFGYENKNLKNLTHKFRSLHLSVFYLMYTSIWLTSTMINVNPTWKALNYL